MMHVVLDRASECLFLVGVRDWLDGSVLVVGGVVTLNKQLGQMSSWLI